MSELQLRPYQAAAIEQLRAGIRAGHKRQILYAPTGAGKTEMAMALILEADQKFSRTAFLIDRIALCDQSADRFAAAKIAFGVIQAGHWRWRPHERHQICSVQTLVRRGMPEGTSMMIVDEAHTMYRTTTDFMLAHPDIITIGLTATPFTKGMGQLYSNVVNVATTDELIADGFLVPVKAYAAKAADMRGAAVKFNGEWSDSDIEFRAMTVVGDIITEWMSKTAKHFGGGVKTLVFSASVAHGEELCRRFQDAGYNFQQVSYKDGNDEKRKALIDEFRKADSEIMGLVSCEALAKGFDVPDVLCGIAARPYRKSLSGHIQQIGRVMRPHPGKEFSLWLDHSGNFLRFREDMQMVFSQGIPNLDERGLDNKVRPEPDEDDKKANACGGCGFFMTGPSCPACGWERPARQNLVQEISGELHEVGLKKSKASAMDAVLQDKQSVWRQICHMALDRKGGDVDAAGKFALAQYRNLYGEWPRYAMRNITPEPAHPLVIAKVQSQIIAWSRRAKR